MPLPQVRERSGENLKVIIGPDNVPRAFQDQSGDVWKDGQLWLVGGCE